MRTSALRLKLRALLPDAALVAGLVVLIFLVFWQSLYNDFVTWDDHTYLLKNRFVWGFTWTNVIHSFSTFLSGNYHPLPLLTYMAEYAAVGLDPFLYKFDNLLLHALCSALLFAFLRLSGFQRRISFVAVLLFALHPMRVEAVAWVTGRKDLLSAFFCLLAMVAEARYVRTGRRVYYFLTLSLLPLALLSKGTAMVLPWALLLTDAICGRRIDRRAITEKIPHALVAGIFVVVAIYARASFQEALQEDFGSLLDNAAYATYRLFFYYLLRTIVVIPHFFTLYPPESELLAWGGIGLAGLCLVAAGGWVFRKRNPKAGLGLLFYGTMLVPALPLENLGYWADRFAYFPALGLAVFVASVIAGSGADGFGRKRRALVLTGLLVPAVCVLSLMTYNRCLVWRDTLSLFSDAVAEYSRRPGMEVRRARAYLDRGRTWLEMKRMDVAMADFREAMAAAPREPLLMLEDLAGVSLAAGKYEESAALFTVVLEEDRDSLAALIGRASAYYLSGETRKALSDLLVAEGVAPDNPEIQNALALTYLLLGQREDALDALSRLIRLDPDNAMAKKKRAEILGSGRVDR